MTTKVVSISVEEELLKSIDEICKEYSSQKKVKYTRSQFFTESALFLIGFSQEAEKHSQNNLDNKEEQ